MAHQVLLLFDQRENRKLLTNWLEKRYSVIAGESGEKLDEMCDLIIVDGSALSRLNSQIQTRKEVEQPVFLPVLLVSGRQDIGLAKRHLWHSVDELLPSPVEKVELQARVETLLRARRLSIQLKRFSEDQEAFIHAMTHDLRAPLRAVKGYTSAMLEETAPGQDDENTYLLHRVQSASDDMQVLIDSLLDFSRLGRDEVHLQPVSLSMIVESCVLSLRDEIRASGADVIVPGDLPVVQAHPTLLKVALTNLLTNALKYVPASRCPRVEISAQVSGHLVVINVRDNGIGISPEDQERIFDPFTRLHGVDEYPGVGLGLPTVRKALEVMGGRIDVVSETGKGSEFLIELNHG